MAEQLWIIDRIEAGIAVVEREEGELRLPRDLLPPGAREGDVLAARLEVEAGAVTWRIRIDREATARRARELRALHERLRGKDPGGDIEL